MLKYMIILFGLTCFSCGLHADSLSGHAKKFWLYGSILTLVQAATAHSQEAGQCVHDWYFKGDQSYKNGLVEASLEKHSDAPPTAVLIALTEHFLR